LSNSFADLLKDPPRDYSLLPFWFWNDELSEPEILRQIADFEAHGVYGFVIHPRVGLPREIGWMSDRLLGYMQIAIDQAARRHMKVIFYDEGMYPSGSSSGQVVAADPELACRCLARIQLQPGQQYQPAPGENLVGTFDLANGQRIAVIDRKVDAYIRGLHYINDGPAEDEPPMADILNPLATQKIINLVYDKFAQAFSSAFNSTVIGIFTDEPNALGKCREKDVWPGTAGILGKINALLGYDFTPHLPALWFDDEPDAPRYRTDYRWAIQRRLEQTWYQPLADWCRARHIALCGHPAAGDEIGAQRFFDIPGQDLVWRFIEPAKPSALQGPESTQAKGTSSAMIHLNRSRNSNEFCGAYGPQTTFTEMKWLADWCLVRGVNLLIPHAFYYSVRGPRRDERPPQLGPNSPWWDSFKPFADHCRRLCWLNAESIHVCDIAILTGPDDSPWQAAKVCFENQRDFNYLELRLLEDSAVVDADAVSIAKMRYRLLILDGNLPLSETLLKKLQPFQQAGRLYQFDSSQPHTILQQIDQHCTKDLLITPPAPGLRYRHLLKSGIHFYLLFNESPEPINTKLQVSALGPPSWVNTVTGATTPCTGELNLTLDSYAVALLQCIPPTS
jgi:hypothetical protein